MNSLIIGPSPHTKLYQPNKIMDIIMYTFKDIIMEIIIDFIMNINMVIIMNIKIDIIIDFNMVIIMDIILYTDHCLSVWGRILTTSICWLFTSSSII